MPQAEISLMWQARPASGTLKIPHANQEISVPGQNCSATIKKRQTSRRIEDIPRSYLVSIVAKGLWRVKRFLACDDGPVSEIPTTWREPVRPLHNDEPEIWVGTRSGCGYVR
jgi:hypothetical protein